MVGSHPREGGSIRGCERALPRLEKDPVAVWRMVIGWWVRYKIWSSRIGSKTNIRYTLNLACSGIGRGWNSPARGRHHPLADRARLARPLRTSWRRRVVYPNLRSIKDLSGFWDISPSHALSLPPILAHSATCSMIIVWLCIDLFFTSLLANFARTP